MLLMQPNSKQKIKRCIVHKVRNSLQFVPCENDNTATSNLNITYQSLTQDKAELELARASDKWNDKYPQISRSWRINWENLNTLFVYPEDIRKVIYTNNGIELHH